MKTSVEILDPVQVKLTVEVEPKRVKQAFDRAARELAKEVQIPGFRPGKAPRRLLEQRFGEGAIAQAAMEDAIAGYYIEALQEEDLDPVAQPELDVESFDEKDGCTFTATVEVRPSIEAPDHTGITVSSPEWDVEDAAVDEQLDTMRQRFAEVEPVERAAATGDLVTIDLRIEVDGEEIESAKVEDALYEIGSGGVTPKLDEHAVGAEAGDDVTYEDELPDGYPEHGGKTATFHVHVKDVREKVLPELDDDFAMTASGFDTLDELRDDLRNSLLRSRVEEARHQVRGRVLEAYLARVDVPLPPAMVEAEKQQRVDNLERQAERYGLDVEQLLEAQGTSREEFDTNAEEQAEQAVKAQLVLDALADRLQPPLEPADIEREIARHAYTSGASPQDVAQIIQEQGTLPMLIGDVRRRKTIDEIVAQSTIEHGPSDEVLRELGLVEDPDAEVDAVTDADETDLDTDAPEADAPEADVDASEADAGDDDDESDDA